MAFDNFITFKLISFKKKTVLEYSDIFAGSACLQVGCVHTAGLKMAAKVTK